MKVNVVFLGILLASVLLALLVPVAESAVKIGNRAGRQNVAVTRPPIRIPVKKPLVEAKAIPATVAPVPLNETLLDAEELGDDEAEDNETMPIEPSTSTVPPTQPPTQPPTTTAAPTTTTKKVTTAKPTTTPKPTTTTKAATTTTAKPTTTQPPSTTTRAPVTTRRPCPRRRTTTVAPSTTPTTTPQPTTTEEPVDPTKRCPIIKPLFKHCKKEHEDFRKDCKKKYSKPCRHEEKDLHKHVCKHRTMECFLAEQTFMDKCMPQLSPKCQIKMKSYRVGCEKFNIEFRRLGCPE